MEKIKVLIVDDSLLTRKVLSGIIESDPDLKLVGTANDGKFAVGKIPFLKPDIITLDVNMPLMDGLTTLQQIMQKYPTPIIMVSAATKEDAETTIKALELGAVDFIAKPEGDSDVSVISRQLVEKIKNSAKIKVEKLKATKEIKLPSTQKELQIELDKAKPFAKKIVAIGISTGGPNAIKSIFADNYLDESLSILIVQHMPDTFTGAFANRLNQVSNLRVKEAEEGDPILEGHVYVAPGHSHLLVTMKSGKPYIKLSQEEKRSGHRPSADVLFESVAGIFGSKVVGVIMTGMGRDGADGMAIIKKNGGHTIAQDEATSVVYGMNKEAVSMGCVDQIIPLNQIAKCFTDIYKNL